MELCIPHSAVHYSMHGYICKLAPNVGQPSQLFGPLCCLHSNVRLSATVQDRYPSSFSSSSTSTSPIPSPYLSIFPFRSPSLSRYSLRITVNKKGILCQPALMRSFPPPASSQYTEKKTYKLFRNSII